MNLDCMMNKCIEMFPGNEWKIEYKYMKDLDNDLVPYCFVCFGKENENGEFESLFVETYECALYEYEGTIEGLVKKIYDNIMDLLN